MPSLGFGEILVILVFALIIFGPRRLPEMGRQVGRSLREFRRQAAELRAEVEQDLDEPPSTPAGRRKQIEDRQDSPSEPPGGGTAPD
ncbi:MAG: Sec-independent protein translocase subunit TatA/TatB [Actinomycetota bacterium]